MPSPIFTKKPQKRKKVRKKQMLK